MGQVIAQAQECGRVAFLLLLFQVLRDLVEHRGEGAEVVVLFYVEFE